MAVLGDLVVNLSANTRSFNTALTGAENRVMRFSQVVPGSVRSIGTAFTSIAGSIASVGMQVVRLTAKFGALALAASGIGAAFGAGQILSLAADAESAAVQLEVMTGSAQQAQRVILSMRALAKTSPFGEKELTSAVKTMVLFGMESERAMGLTKTLAEIAGGDAQRLESLSLAFAQAGAAGRLMGQDLLQMVNAGFNPLQEISQRTGESMVDLKKRMEDGKVSFDEIMAATNAATEAGGRFFGMNDRMMETTSGKWQLFKETLTNIARMLGTELLPVVNAVIDRMQEFAASVETVVSKFASMPDKWTWLSDTVKAAWDVAIEYVKLQWRNMLADLINKTSAAAWEIGKAMMNPFAGVSFQQIEDALGKASEAGLKKAQGRFGMLLRQLEATKPPDIPPAGQPPGAPPQVPAPPGAVAVNTGDMRPATITIDSEAVKSITGTPKTGIAAALEQGTAAAWDTIIRAMNRNQNSPEVNAIQQMQGAVVNALQPLQNLQNNAVVLVDTLI